MQVRRCEEIYDSLMQAVDDDLEFWRADMGGADGTNRFVAD